MLRTCAREVITTLSVCFCLSTGCAPHARTPPDRDESAPHAARGSNAVPSPHEGSPSSDRVALPCDVAWLRGGELFLRSGATGRDELLSTVDPPWPRYLEWSPDGRTLLHARHDTGWNVWALQLETGQSQRLTIPGDNRVPSWSPDGAAIAWQRGGEGVWVQSADGLAPRQVSDRGHRDSRPSWSPDGAWIAFEHIDEAGVPEVWVARAREPSVGDVARAEPPGPPAYRLRVYAGGPAWSPDGLSIACKGWHEGRRALLCLDPRVPDAAPLRVVTTDEDYLGEPAWSRDGRRLAWARAQGNGARLFVAELDATPRGVFTYEGRVEAPCWTPDGEWVLVRTSTHVVAVRIADGATVTIGEPSSQVAAPRPK